MTQPNFRALCAELVEAWKDDLPYARMIDLIARATNALATPPPEPLSPAAQALLDAYFTHADLLNREVSHEEMIATALRADRGQYH